MDYLFTPFRFRDTISPALSWWHLTLDLQKNQSQSSFALCCFAVTFLFTFALPVPLCLTFDLLSFSSFVCNNLLHTTLLNLIALLHSSKFFTLHWFGFHYFSFLWFVISFTAVSITWLLLFWRKYQNYWEYQHLSNSLVFSWNQIHLFNFSNFLYFSQ